MQGETHHPPAVGILAHQNFSSYLHFLTDNIRHARFVKRRRFGYPDYRVASDTEWGEWADRLS